jgi:hypothetical protein
VAIFVINEWLWHDLSGDNGRQVQEEALNVLTKLSKSDHRIAVVEGSPFDQKAWTLCKTANPMILQAIGRLYVRTVRLNPDRCLILRHQETVDLPPDLASEVNVDDEYLVKALLTAEGAVLVTTDAALRESLTKAGRNCISREEFVAAILQDL